MKILSRKSYSRSCTQNNVPHSFAVDRQMQVLVFVLHPCCCLNRKWIWERGQSCYMRPNLFSECGDGILSLCPRRSMNGFLIVYLCILISKAVINTVLKYAWQWSPDRDEPWYNHRTENERQRHVVGSPLSSKATPTSLDLKMLHRCCPPPSPICRWSEHSQTSWPSWFYLTTSSQCPCTWRWRCRNSSAPISSPGMRKCLMKSWEKELRSTPPTWTRSWARYSSASLHAALPCWRHFLTPVSTSSQVEYVFTDKTGTLTENNMEFIECCVDGNVYIPHAICNGQILSAASSIDMIDSSPGGYRRVSLRSW